VLPSVAIAKIESDKDIKYYVNTHTTTQALESVFGYLLLRFFPSKDTISYRQAKVAILILGLIGLLSFLIGIS